MAQEAIDVYLRMLRESNKSRFYSYSVRNSVSIISHVTFWDCNARTFFHITFHEIAVCVGSILALV